jgi:hypothetical protein
MKHPGFYTAASLQIMQTPIQCMMLRMCVCEQLVVTLTERSCVEVHPDVTHEDQVDGEVQHRQRVRKVALQAQQQAALSSAFKRPGVLHRALHDCCLLYIAAAC